MLNGTVYKKFISLDSLLADKLKEVSHNNKLEEEDKKHLRERKRKRGKEEHRSLR